MIPTDPVALELAAREQLSEAAYAFYAYGCGAEQSLEENVTAWRRWHLRPRMLRGATNLSTKTTALGTEIAFPVLVAPCGLNRLANDDGELAVARAAAAAGTIQILSNTTSTPIEDVAKATDAPKWFQLYCGATQDVTDDRIRRAIDNGFRAIAVTVDTPFLGIRYKGLANLEAFGKELARLRVEGAFIETPNLDWKEIERICSSFDVPVLLKGILHPGDARLAVEHGARGVIVSNHGARQLDGTIPPALALPDVIDAVGGAAEVYVDGGVRNGSDVLRALALGARAVLVGRPYLWALALGGEAAVVELLTRLHNEVRNVMALAGQTDATAVDRDIVVRA